MVESEPIVRIEIDSVNKFAQVLAGWDRRITEVISLVSLTDFILQDGNKLEIICRFDPEPLDDNHGYLSAFNLLFRDDHENASNNLGITNPIDIGFIFNDGIYLPSGEIIRLPNDYEVLWSKDDE